MTLKQNNLPQPQAWKPSEVETIKTNSNYLRGTLEQSLNDAITGAIAPDDTQLIKFHGSYQQTDRDLDEERKNQKLEPLYSFMIRARVPAGIATAAQWLAMDELADKYGNGTLKLTTRQAFQLHGIVKKNLRQTIQGINDALLDSIAACGDVNRNVMSTSNEGLSPVVGELAGFAKAISEHLLPKTTAYHEIWLNKQLVTGGQQDEEPIYGKTYLPRKFKIAIAVPPYNDTDVFANDIGLIAIVKDNQLLGYNVAVGGGMGKTYGMPETYPRLADVIGFVPKDKALAVVEEIVKVQRDFGNRENRKLARLKYTLDRIGSEVFVELLQARLGFELEDSKPYVFESNGDVFGWKKAADGKWFLGLHIEHGRIKDTDALQLKQALKEVAQLEVCDFRLTGNQGLVLGNVITRNKLKIQEILGRYAAGDAQELSGLRKHAIACVALNTCTMAFAEAERYLPSLVTKLESLLEKFGLSNEDILIRMTGCPNGCGRPFLGEIGLVGRAMGKYNLYLGAGFAGERLNTLYKEMVSEADILQLLEPLFESYAGERAVKERFGDFLVRTGVIVASQQVQTIK
ncbi:NADPH-dependent assimilatory sulfite reductase hemoprotein subunit [Carboxylicivirga mesophila]|uniref:NADPH-dependent assimilatory sulfite reductase hemoprotein subunit n=1 Tax=Carboxylicivirga mesophila TaxID=1166478 RepID=A0ABS5KFW7_9BACT|nr:NADPH-dependent assimilatory sulfite reductase hemoprotein subunit [Carboxylicivirga mesophila]MBS2213421.1 NADPH-dependent assimilatory sulfite reductase hemoprotein subunit [Carboxylicivirga mesophila]